MYNNDLTEFKKDFSSYSYTDEETKKAMKTIYEQSKYIADPHGAVGYLGLKKELSNYPESIGFFLETAHPIKFLDIVEPTLNTSLKVPIQIKAILNKEKSSIKISSYNELKNIILTK